MAGGEAARAYHEETKHSLARLQASPQGLDWANQPLPYKIYQTLAPIPLPSELPPSDRPALEAIGRATDVPPVERVPDLAALARLCFYANGVTRRIRRAGGEMAFRAAGTTGALYHVELYLVCGEVPDLPAGVYHYGAHDHALRRLRGGDFRGVLVDATGAEPAVASAPVVVVCTSTFWRNAWKYQARAYRHSFWDIGTVLANFLALATAADLPTRLVLGFADAAVNDLLDVDPLREAAICLVALGRGRPALPPRLHREPTHSLGLPTVPLSPTERIYPAIGAAHEVSSLPSGEQAARWRGAPPELAPPPAEPSVPLRPIDPAALPRDPIEKVIRRRGSSRAFDRTPIAFEQLSTLLSRTVRGIPADCLGSGGEPLGTPYLIVNAVDDLAPGAYVLGRDRAALAPLKRGDFRDAAGRLALGQELGADASVDVYFLTDLDAVLARFGDRGYRAGQLTSAVSAGQLWLAAYALGLGATGLTFFDDEVSAFFSSNRRSDRPTGQAVMFLLAIGRVR